MIVASQNDKVSGRSNSASELVRAVFVKYDKNIGGDTMSLSGLMAAMSVVLTGKKQDVQSLIGETEGEGKITYEFVITTPRFVGYRYRAFFL